MAALREEVVVRASTLTRGDFREVATVHVIAQVAVLRAVRGVPGRDIGIGYRLGQLVNHRVRHFVGALISIRRYGLSQEVVSVAAGARLAGVGDQRIADRVLLTAERRSETGVICAKTLAEAGNLYRGCGDHKVHAMIVCRKTARIDGGGHDGGDGLAAERRALRRSRVLVE